MSVPIGRVFSVTVTTALYRRYRPDSFADVIGQEHVTAPLMTALRKNRVNHAYLFSGPRGCGKTTSARILARCLNCAEGPTDTPCGTCPSCIELARGGSGSLDVIEIDAASHGGVDDARDLRERATYAPVRDRYKIFIIDEAHMVTSAGFNALLKIVEEPPEHIKFIFATTEPDKVIGTIRSRTHHYPFRLVPPEPLMAYLELLCTQENVPVAPGVLSLVIRAGGGSVRDSLSVLDQLMAGAGPNGLDYELAVALLGYTHASLLDDVVEAVAASDAATVFRAVDRVIQTGHDPRRFVEDLLERFRDLIIVQAMPESAQSILRGMPADQITRLQNQAHNLGAAELSRAADVTNTALTEMTGATSPRLHLELLCARILLPSSEQNERGIAARIDRVERRLNYAGNDVGAPAAAGAAPAVGTPAVGTRAVATPPAATAPAATPPAAAPATPAAAAHPPAASAAQLPAASAEPARPTSAEAREPLTAPRLSTADWPVDEAKAGPRPAQASAPAPQGDPAGSRAAAASTPAATAASDTGPSDTAPSDTASSDSAPQPAGPPPAAAPPAPAPPAPAPSGADVEVLRRAWPEILQALTKIKRSTWALVEPNAQVGQFDGQVLTLAFTTPGLAGAFGRADHSENLRQAIHKTVGIDCQITAVSGGTGSSASAEPNPKAPASRETPAMSADAAWGLGPAAENPTPPAPGPGPDASVPSVESVPAVVSAPAVASAPSGTSAATGPSAANLPASSPSPASGPARNAPTGGNAGSGEAPGDHSPASAAPPAADDAEPAPEDPAAPPPAVSAAPSETSGSYGYPDDDWGPPRDEDAPPLEEEPPMDWDPSAPVQARPAPTATPPAPALATGRTAPARKSASTRTSGQPAAGQAVGAQATAEPTDTSHDPWSRATEQAPGVWTTGTESNVGKLTAASGVADDTADVPAPPAPRYEPAAAQVPQMVGAASGTVGAAGSIGPAADGWAPGAQVPAPAAERTPVAAGPAVQPVAPAAPPAAFVSQPAPATAANAAAAEARQSLYQRLSNSPEAEAGRAKAPARQAEASKAYVHDIPSADDETIEESGVFGRAAVERILGGKLVEERSLDGSPLPPRF
jgi:DNA polymerase III subunit gamma/tau